MKKFIFLIMILVVLLSLAACTSDVVTTSPESTEAPATWLPESSTAPITTVPMISTLPETTEVPVWMEMLEDNFFDKAVEKNGEYYIYLAYAFESSRYAVCDNRTFAEAYIADKNDIVFANLESGMISQGMYLRATIEELEAYAKNSYVTGIYSYPADKVSDGCESRVERGGDYQKFTEYAENKEAVLNRTQMPLVKIDSREELDALYGMGQYTRYDEAFFAENSLLMISISESTGSARHALVHVIVDEGVTVVIDRVASWAGTDDAPTWVMLVEVKKSAIENQTEFNVIMHRGGY